MKVVVAIASHQRHHPLNIVLRCLPKDWHAVVVVTDQADEDAIIDRPNTHISRFDNNPVGAKWQHAVNCARALHPDLLVITGSDDVIIGNTAKLAKAIKGHDALGLRKWLAFDGQQHYAMAYREHVQIPVGCGRVYTKALLERIRWQVFDTTRDRGLDQQGYYSTLRVGGTCPIVDHIDGLQVVSLKGTWPQYNPLPKLIRSNNMLITNALQQKMLADYAF